jgi:predicted nucleic acid-binding protein
MGMTNIKTVLLDSNILVYASDLASPFNAGIRHALEQDLQFFVADRSLLEFYRVVTGPLKLSVETALANIEYYNSNYTILTATDFSNQLTFELASQYQAKSGKIFDLNFLAIALENEIDILYTKNIRDYPENSEIQIIDPTI